MRLIDYYWASTVAWCLMSDALCGATNPATLSKVRLPTAHYVVDTFRLDSLMHCAIFIDNIWWAGERLRKRTWQAKDLGNELGRRKDLGNELAHRVPVTWHLSRSLWSVCHENCLQLNIFIVYCVRKPPRARRSSTWGPAQWPIVNIMSVEVREMKPETSGR